MMPDLRQYLPTLPPEAQPVLVYLASAGAVFGVVLWLLGSRFSRSLITLVAVAVGASLGLHVPRWLGLTIDTWASAVGGALVLGVAGYILHGGVVRVGLGFIMGAAATSGAYLINPPASDWTFPAYSPEVALSQYAQQLWQAVSEQFRTTIPTALVLGLGAGWIIAAFLPRWATALFHSFVGLTLATILGSFVAAQQHPQWLEYLPQARTAQLLAFGVLVLAGAALQAWLFKRPASRTPSSKNKETAADFLPTKEMGRS